MAIADLILLHQTTLESQRRLHMCISIRQQLAFTKRHHLHAPRNLRSTAYYLSIHQHDLRDLESSLYKVQVSKIQLYLPHTQVTAVISRAWLYPGWHVQAHLGVSRDNLRL